ncbi:MAG: hypothetical protein KA112_04845 [Alphaproteobacteria bacterium]|jgi:hypothetical protein|nr:hypothetical protein [Alphaproteobacteria bacterium]MBP7729916.1 hypothetical protein [Alphaproteobacteria bacterium]MDP3443454.1 hypothetical protein [Ignavibacteria bacterium]
MYKTIPRSLYVQGITPNKQTSRKVELLRAGEAAGVDDVVTLKTAILRFKISASCF